MKPLLETRAFWSYIDERICVVAVHHAYDMILGNNINIEDMLQHPAALVEQQCRCRIEQLADMIADREIIQCLPSQIKEVETENQQDEKPYINR